MERSYYQENNENQRTLETASLLTLFFQEQERQMIERIKKSKIIDDLVENQFSSFLEEYNPEQELEEKIDSMAVAYMEENLDGLVEDQLEGQLETFMIEVGCEQVDNAIDRYLKSKEFQERIKRKISNEVEYLLTDLNVTVSI